MKHLSYLLILAVYGCAIPIRDALWCSPLPENAGVVCNSFLSKEQTILSQEQWNALTAQWNAQGSAVECTTSRSLGDIKLELEALCARTGCSYDKETNFK